MEAEATAIQGRSRSHIDSVHDKKLYSGTPLRLCLGYYPARAMLHVHMGSCMSP